MKNSDDLLMKRLREDYDSAIQAIGDNPLFDNLITDEWLDSKEAAAYLRLPLKSLYNLTSNGTLIPYKLEGRNRFLISELRDFLLSSKQGDHNGY